MTNVNVMNVVSAIFKQNITEKELIQDRNHVDEKTYFMVRSSN